ncbi:VanW family protein [Gordonia polyisoprenivorans]|uniref:VanW family protein n=2 Tax=Gordonia polyisoprenivorans TaxID=84595 RepID=UPI0003A58F87
MSDSVGSARRRRWRVGARITTGVISVILLTLSMDLLVTSGHTARGAVTAGRDVGNLSPVRLDHRLDEMMQQASVPVRLRTESGSATVDPAALGVMFDAEATAAALQRQPRSPLTRLLALFGRTHDVAPVVRVDAARFDEAIAGHHRDLERSAVDGGVHYAGATPVADLPAAGRRVDRDAARAVLAREWLDGDVVDLPMEPFAPSVSAEVVRATVAGPATRAVSDDVEISGRGGVRVSLSPRQIGAILTFVPDGRGGLVAYVDRQRGRTALAALRDSESRPADARFSLATGRPRVVPARNGARVDWDKTFAAVERAVVGTGPRTVAAAYRTVPPALSTEKARSLGVTEVIGEFTTGGFSSASGENIRLVAAEVDGALILPGKNFSLNTHTGPRGSAQGYVSSTIIDHGRASNAVGGGISQFATTLYNAAYFAGLADVDHTEHAYYISRYPEAREATVFEGAIDLVIGNTSRHGVLIETTWSPSSVTVRLWGTTSVEVQSITGERHAYTTPEVRRVPRGPDCIASRGSRGFTTSDTRVITDARTGALISRHTRTVRYAPEPIVRCI